jgi:hypothetical protein
MAIGILGNATDQTVQNTLSALQTLTFNPSFQISSPGGGFSASDMGSTNPSQSVSPILYPGGDSASIYGDASGREGNVPSLSLPASPSNTVGEVPDNMLTGILAGGGITWIVVIALAFAVYYFWGK